MHFGTSARPRGRQPFKDHAPETQSMLLGKEPGTFSNNAANVTTLEGLDDSNRVPLAQANTDWANLSLAAKP